MTPDEFVRKWKNVELNERAAAQSHFIDLCRMLDEPAPTDVDPKGDWYAFERGATKTTGGEGWADVWKREHFGWEYKGKRKDLRAAFAQLQQYALALENPPLLVVCDMDRFEIHTNWTNSVSSVHDFSLDDLRDANIRQKLKWVFSDPEQLKPGKTRQALTEQAAAEFAKLAQRLRDRDHPAEVRSPKFPSATRSSPQSNSAAIIGHGANHTRQPTLRKDGLNPTARHAATFERDAAQCAALRAASIAPFCNGPRSVNPFLRRTTRRGLASVRGRRAAAT